jgi:hypothetical protein
MLETGGCMNIRVYVWIIQRMTDWKSYRANQAAMRGAEYTCVLLEHENSKLIGIFITELKVNGLP